MALDNKIFFDEYRKQFGGVSQQLVDALNHILPLVEKELDGGMQLEKMAYILATAKHETAHTFEPVREAYWLSESWRKRNLRYYPYYGRGFVQLTWRDNYLKQGNRLGVDLVGDPDLALKPEYAWDILVDGMMSGSYNGQKKGLDYYINDRRVDYYSARRTVNILDKAGLIAGIARDFESILRKSYVN